MAGRKRSCVVMLFRSVTSEQLRWGRVLELHRQRPSSPLDFASLPPSSPALCTCPITPPHYALIEHPSVPDAVPTWPTPPLRARPTSCHLTRSSLPRPYPLSTRWKASHPRAVTNTRPLRSCRDNLSMWRYEESAGARLGLLMADQVHSLAGGVHQG